MKKISVIIPAYNCEGIIERCINSILFQKYDNVEIIIINDGSTDNTKKICEKLSNKYDNVLLINKVNEGPGAARQVGLENATGQYISFIDSDDYIDENFYLKLVYALEKNNADIVECGYITTNEDCSGKIEHNMIAKIIEGSEKCAMYHAKQKNTTNYLCNKLYKKKLFTNIEFIHLFASEDSCVLLQLFANANKIVIIPEPLYYYVQTSNSLCRKPYNIKKNDIVKAGIYMYTYCKNKYPELCEYYSLFICSSAAQCYSNLRYSNIENRETLMKDMIRIYKEYYSKNNSKNKEVSKKRLGLVKLFNISPNIASWLYRRIQNK